MTVQLFGTKKSNATKKIERYLKERSIPFQFIDIASKAPAERELEALASAAGGFDELIDSDSKSYRNRRMEYLDFDAREELLQDATLLRVPAIRCDAGVAIQPDEKRLAELLGR